EARRQTQFAFAVPLPRADETSDVYACISLLVNQSNGAGTADCSVLPDPFLADRDDADRFHHAIGRRDFEAAIRHHLADQRGRLGPRYRRLDADADEAV